MKSEWNKLDNAAKIFPAAQSKKDTQVFRFSCELYKTVNKDLLQKAKDEHRRRVGKEGYIAPIPQGVRPTPLEDIGAQ